MSGPEREGRFCEVAGALLLGGASRRMGRDKGGLEIRGEPVARRLAVLLEDLFEEVLLVGGEPSNGPPGRRVADVPGPRCALRGLVGALAAARAPRVLVLATDLVGLTPDLLLALLALPEADAVLPECPEAGLQPLCALYRREPVLAHARERLAEGRLSLHGLLEKLETRTLAGPQLAAVDPAGTALLNVNTPEDLAAAEVRLAKGNPR